MFRSHRQNLFREHRLDHLLRQQGASFDEEVRSISLEKISEPELNDQLLSKYSLTVPVLDDKNIDIDAHEATVTVHAGHSRLAFRDGPVQVPGLSITVKIPFSGKAELFKCQPSTYSPSGTPEATIENDNLVMHYETTEKDPEKIKGLWKSDISVIQQNLGWVAKDVEQYNNSLRNSIQTALAKRKQDAESNKSLIDKLKG